MPLRRRARARAGTHVPRVSPPHRRDGVRYPPRADRPRDRPRAGRRALPEGCPGRALHEGRRGERARREAHARPVRQRPDVRHGAGHLRPRLRLRPRLPRALRRRAHPPLRRALQQPVRALVRGAHHARGGRGRRRRRRRRVPPRGAQVLQHPHLSPRQGRRRRRRQRRRRAPRGGSQGEGQEGIQVQGGAVGRVEVGRAARARPPRHVRRFGRRPLEPLQAQAAPRGFPHHVHLARVRRDGIADGAAKQGDQSVHF
mmetsp:Transcript_9475/g.38755  ORF Transcript_9475/g.38755 Transcript_9475/m.38755 type:complete len:257 (+) Transcript_9475:3-773(+)